MIVQPRTARDRTTNVLLAAIAVMLGLNLLPEYVSIPRPAEANAQESRPGGALISAAEQRKQTLAELRRLNSAVQSLEARLDAGFNVKVTEMPQIRMSKD